MRKTAVLVLLMFALAAFAQGPPKPDAQLAAMKKLDYLVGTWEGEGWVEMMGPRTTFRGTEVITRKLGGVALLVEGAHFSNDVPVHTTLAVMSYDPQAKTYAFDTWLANGMTGEYELVVNDNGWSWDIRTPMGVMRYSMTINDAGEWVEIGERSRDGAQWKKFFEMKLKKK
jgi:hypothetical protein